MWRAWLSTIFIELWRAIPLVWFGFLLSVAGQAETLEEKLVRANIGLSQQIDRFAEGLDIFLAGGKLSDKKNETSVVLSHSTYSVEGEGVEDKFRFDVNLRLPNLEEHWKLRFTSYDESEEDRGVSKSYLRKTPQEENYGASIGLFKNIGKVRTTFRPRVELKDPLQISHTLRFENEMAWEDSKLRPKVEFFAKPDKGTGVFTSLNWERILDKAHTFTLVNEGEYEDHLNQFSASNGFVLGQAINKKVAIGYSLFFQSVNRPTYHLARYVVSTGISHALLKRVLELRLIPFLDFDKGNSFKGKAGITLNVNLIF